MQVDTVHFARVAGPRKPRVDVTLLSPLAQRLRQARLARGCMEAKEAAERFGFGENTYASHEAGTRRPKPDTIERYAKAFRVSLSWLLTGEGMMESVRIAGQVGAGQVIYPIDDDAGFEYAQRPANAEGEIEAVIVRGDSMHPVYRDNDLIIYEKRFVDFEQLIGRECVVRLKDGRSLIKILRRGERKGRFDLESFNAALIEGVEIETAYPVRWIEKRGKALAGPAKQR